MKRTTLFALALPAQLALLPGSALAEVRTYEVDVQKSSVLLSVGRAGLLRFAGHEHEVAAPPLTGEIRLNRGEIGRSSVLLTFAADALRVTGRGEPPEDVPQVQSRMVGPDVLDAAHFPDITFRSVSVIGSTSTPDSCDLELSGDLSLHGVTRRLTFPVHLETSADTLRASGSVVLRQRDFGIDPVSVAGVVKVKNELRVSYRIVAIAR